MAGNDSNATSEMSAAISMDTLIQIKYVCDRMMPIVASIGIVGNILSLVVLTRQEMTSVPILFLKALSVCNLCELLVGIPVYLQINKTLMTIDNFKIFFRFYRIIQYGLVNFFSVCSNWIITTLTIERFLSLYFISGGSKFICTPQRAKITICLILVASFALNVLKFFEYTVNLDPRNRTSHSLTALGRDKDFQTFSYGSHIILDTLLPILILILFNCLLLGLLLRHRRRVAKSGLKSCVDMMHVTLLVMSMVTLFVLLHALSVYIVMHIIILGQLHVQSSRLFFALTRISNLLTTTNTSCNFILYCAILQKFRHTFKRIFLCQTRESYILTRTSSSKERKESLIRTSYV